MKRKKKKEIVKKQNIQKLDYLWKDSDADNIALSKNHKTIDSQWQDDSIREIRLS